MGRPRKEIDHGSPWGAATHRKRGEAACEECRAAKAKYQRERRANDPRVAQRSYEVSTAQNRAVTALVQENKARYQELYGQALAEIRGIR